MNSDGPNRERAEQPLRTHLKNATKRALLKK